MDKETLLAMSNEEQISYWLGRICIAVGRGDVRNTVYQIIDFYTQVGYERGQAAKDSK